MHFRGVALALPLLLCAMPATAQSNDETRDNTIVSIGQRPDEHGPAGLMGDHVHDKGVLMVGLEWMHSDYGGVNQSGTEPVSDAVIAAAGYSARTQSMRMDMAMLHIMYAPNDTVTFTLMPMWMRMEMSMVGVGAPMDGGMMPDSGGMHGGHHMPMPGQTMTHSTEGFGDTEVGALVALSRRPALSAIVGLALSMPTGQVDRKNPDGTFVHYGMQSGSGTWDVIPSFTLKGTQNPFSWGVQGKYRFRTENENDSGFRFGDIFTANAWVAVPLSRWVSVSGRVGYSGEGRVKGHYNATHNHAAPPDRPANYGGQLIDAGLGVNTAFGKYWRLGAEANMPLYQDLNGIQAPKRWGVNASLSRTF